MSKPIEHRLRASVSFDTINGNKMERGICGAQMIEAADEIERLRSELETERGHRQADNAESQAEIERLRAEMAEFRQLLLEAYDAVECTTYDLLLSGEWFRAVEKIARAAGGGDE